MADHLAENDLHALALARTAIRNLNASKPASPVEAAPLPPRLDAQEIYGVIPVDTRKPFDVREIIARVVDNSELDEFKARYGTTLICGFARIEGMPVGIIANNGILFSESALKATHFIELCCQRKVRWCSCRTSPAHGRAQVRERRHSTQRRQDGDGGGHGGRAQFTIIIGGSFGAGNYGMCGRAYSPRSVDVA